MQHYSIASNDCWPDTPPLDEWQLAQIVEDIRILHGALLKAELQYPVEERLSDAELRAECWQQYKAEGTAIYDDREELVDVDENDFDDAWDIYKKDLDHD